MDSMQKICKALDCDVGDICVLNDKSNRKMMADSKATISQIKEQAKYYETNPTI